MRGAFGSAAGRLRTAAARGRVDRRFHLAQCAILDSLPTHCRGRLLDCDAPAPEWENISALASESAVWPTMSPGVRLSCLLGRSPRLGHHDLVFSSVYD